MDLDTGIKGMLKVQEELRSKAGVSNPTLMSTNMMRLSQYAGAVEEKLAEYERDLEVESAKKLRQYMIVEKMKVTQAERMVDIEMSETKGQVKYLTRLVGSAWKQVGVVQSRINHLVREAGTQI